MGGQVMGAYYNEIDPYCAEWLRNLISMGNIAPGRVDERDIRDVEPEELSNYQQCHFFAGIGVWSLALRNAGWPDDRPVWTGSCPCQPFSTAGGRVGFLDERHLWPALHHLVRERRPAVVFGEQVAGAPAGAWLDLVQDDLEMVGYAFGAVVFPAAGVGSPHIRHRLYWVADAESQRWEEIRSDAGRGRQGSLAERLGQRTLCGGILGDAWSNAEWLPCREEKFRPSEPGAFPLANGVAGDVGRLRAYGNAIVEPAAREFVKSFMEISEWHR